MHWSSLLDAYHCLFLTYSSPLIFPPIFSSAYAAKASTPSATCSALSLTASVASLAPLLTVSVASSKYSPAASYASPSFFAAKDDRMFALILSSSSLFGASEGDPRRPAILPVSPHACHVHRDSPGLLLHEPRLALVHDPLHRLDIVRSRGVELLVRGAESTDIRLRLLEQLGSFGRLGREELLREEVEREDLTSRVRQDARGGSVGAAVLVEELSSTRHSVKQTASPLRRTAPRFGPGCTARASCPRPWGRT